MGGGRAASVFGYGDAGEVDIEEGDAVGAFGGEGGGGLFADAASWEGLGARSRTGGEGEGLTGAGDESVAVYVHGFR